MTLSPGLSIDDPAYFECLADAGETHWWSIAMQRIADSWLGHALRGRSGLTAIDVGCGAGHSLRKLADRPEIARVLGVEPSPAALSVAARVPIVQGSALDLPFADRSADVITCFDVVQHLPEGSEPRAAVEVHRVLREDGIALIRSNGRGLWPDETVERPAYRLADLVGIFGRNGFDVLRASYVNCVPAVAAEVLGKVQKRSRDLGHPSGRGLRLGASTRRLAMAMNLVSTVEAFAVGRLGMSLPVGHSTMILVRRGKGHSR